MKFWNKDDREAYFAKIEEAYNYFINKKISICNMEQNNQNISANEEVNSNFITFFTRHKIEIPLIQRDYVQGSNLQSKNVTSLSIPCLKH